MRLRSELMIGVQQTLAAWNVTQVEAARRLHITQPHLNELEKGRIGNFSLDELIDIATKQGLACAWKSRRVRLRLCETCGD